MTANQEIIAELRRVLGERDEARQEREKLLDRVAFLESYSETLQGYQTDLARMLKAVCAERDRLREQLAAKHSECPDCESYSERAGRFAAQADKLQRERDETRAELGALRRAVQNALPLDMTGWGTLLESIPKMGVRLAKAEAERDEARREADRLRHGNTVEGDFVCPNELAAKAATMARDSIEKMIRFELRAQQEEGAQEACRRVVKDRDEARAELHASNEQMDSIAKALQLEHDDGIEDAVTDMVAEMDHARDRIEELRAEVERLRADMATGNESFAAGYKDGARDAYRRGAEAMREACAVCVAHLSHEDGLGMGSQRIEGALRALPIPEDKP